MRYIYNWPPYIGEYPWDFDAAGEVSKAMQWCEQNIPPNSWAFKERKDKFGILHVTFHFQKQEDLVLFQLVCK